MPSADTPQPVTLQTFPPTDAERARIRQLVKKSPLRSLFLAVLAADKPAYLYGDLVDRLLSELERRKDKDWKRRAAAAWILGVSTLPEDRRMEVATSLRHCLKNPPNKIVIRFGERTLSAYRRTLVIVAPIITVLLLWLVSAMREYPEENFAYLQAGIAIIMSSMALSMCLLPISLPLSAIHDAECNDEARAMAAQALARQNALEALPELLEGACGKADNVKIWCRFALVRFLPQITEQNRDLMPLSSEELLGKLLEGIPSLKLGSVVLDYLEKFGQGRNCTAVEFYLKRVLSPNHKAEFAEVYAKGLRVFAMLQERLRQDQESEQLLRHSVAPNAQPNELLRPAADSQTMPAEQLLRASDLE